MKNPLISYASEREEWRNWLAANFEKEKEIFGWMDSIIKHLDPLHRIQRFLREKQTRIIDGFGGIEKYYGCRGT